MTTHRHFLLLLFLIVTSANAAEVSIEKLTAQSQRGRVSVSFTLEGAFDREEVLRELQSGLPTVFTYDVELIRKRSNWFDNVVARSRIEIIATFNSVTREYLVNYRRDRKLVRSEIVKDFEQLKRRMSRIEEQDLFDLGQRRPSKMRIRARADVVQELVFYIVPRTVRTPWDVTRVQTVGSSP